jgi:hypothetical protein
MPVSQPAFATRNLSCAVHLGNLNRRAPRAVGPDLRHLRAGAPLPSGTRWRLCLVWFGALRCLDRWPIAPEPKLFCHRGSAFRIFRRCKRMLRSQIPATPVLVGAQPVPRHQVAAQHVPPPAAVQANNNIALDRSSNRDGGAALLHEFWHFAEVAQRVMHTGDQRGN